MIFNDSAKTKLAMLSFLYCGEFVKNSNVNFFNFRNLMRWTDCWYDRVLDRVDGSTPAQAEYVQDMAVRQMKDFQAYYDCSTSAGLFVVA